jgi:SWI/SNF-related matrix-associated actin-dependent regulator 1 of chromatin subfamily A
MNEAIKITYLKDRFIGHCNFDEHNYFKEAGFTWDNEFKRWTCKDFRPAYKLKQYCDQSAIIQLKLMSVDTQKGIEQSAKTVGSIKIYHPETITPFPYQIAGVEYMLNRNAVLLADEMGLGKTGQAFLVMNMRRNVEALIVCPAILKYNWLKEARKWLVGKVTAYIYESKKIRYYTKQLTPHNKTTILHIINYDILGKFRERLLGTPYNFFVADECHFIKNQDAFRTEIAQELAKKVLWRIFITGTPIYNKPKDLFVPLNLIDTNTFSNFYAFATRYCGAKKMMMAGRSILKFDGATNMDELNQILRSNYMVRRMTKDVLKDLPEKMKDVIVLNEESLEGIVKQEQNVLIKSKNEQATLKLEIEQLRQLVRDNSAYESLYKDKVKKMKESKFKSFGELSRLRKEMGLKKLPYVVEFVKDILENSEDSLSKVVVFGHHTQVLEGIFNGLKKYSPVIVTGKVLDKDRQKAIGLFKEKNKCRVFIGSMGASGVGVDGLQNNCNTVVFAELDWTPALVEQAEARLARIGQTLPVFVYHIVADGSIDSHIAKLMVSKTAVAKEILDYRPEQIYEKFIEQATT